MTTEELIIALRKFDRDKEVKFEFRQGNHRTNHVMTVRCESDDYRNPVLVLNKLKLRQTNSNHFDCLDDNDIL